MIDPVIGVPALTDAAARQAHLRDLSVKLEAGFLAEMLKHTGINATQSEFGGGAGEDAFASLLTREYADTLAQAGGIGLAEHIFRALVEKDSTA